jgi:predicted dienelactone hydrolase
LVRENVGLWAHDQARNDAFMSLMDALLLVAVLAVAAVSIVAPRPLSRLLRLAPLALAVFAALQFTAEGFYWQLLPAWLLIAVMAILALRPVSPTPRARRVGIAVLMLATLGPWMILPVPRLAPPTGPYAVGTEVFRWTDASRPEDATADPADHRNVIVQAWYPAARGAHGPHSTYIDGLGRLPKRVTLLPRFLMAHYGRIDTHGVQGAPVSSDRPGWPVVVFLTGYGAPRAFYSSLVADLASRGYVVLAIDHPYEAAVTQLADGRVVSTVEHFLDHDPRRERFMRGRLDLRADDVSFTLDQLGRPEALGPRLSGHLDLGHIATAGHSAGGAAAALALDRDARIKAAANLDGTYYGAVSPGRLDRPFLLLDSDHGESGHSAENVANNRALFDRFGGGWRFEIARANHFGFTDAPLFFSLPGRLALSLLIGGGRGPVETQRAAVDILSAFLQGPLSGRPADVEAAARRYAGIAGGPVTASAP